MAALALKLEGDVLAAQRGDREAFTRLVDVTRNLVCSIVVAIVRDIDASEDVAQEVFLAAWQGIRRLRNAASFLPWLRQLARNQAHACLRAQRRRRRRLEYADAALARAADPSPAASEHLVSAEEKQVLTDVIDGLPEDAREVVTLYYREDRSARQVAELLDLSEAAVKKRLERARAMVRQALMERFGETVRRSIPGAAFTTAVATALTLSSPPAAAAAAAATTAGLKASAKLALGLAWSGLGVLGGLAGVLIGHHLRSRQAHSERERRELGCLAVASSLVVVAFGIGIRLSHGPAELVAIWVLLAAAIGLLYLGWLPRILRPGQLLELAEDPEAWRRHRAQARRRVIGFGFGVVGGGAAVAYAAYVLWHAH